MDALTKVQSYLVSQHNTAAGTWLTCLCLSITGVAAFKASKAKADFPLALVWSFFRFAYPVNLVYYVLTDPVGPPGLAKLFSSATLQTNPFVIHTLVYVVLTYAPDDMVGKMLKTKYVAPLIAGICAINAGACGMAAIDANAKTGFPYGLIVGFAVWFGSYFCNSEEITLEGMIRGSFTLVPYYFYDTLKATVIKKVNKPEFVLGLAYLQLALVLLETFAKVSVVAKLAALYGKIPTTWKGLKGVKLPKLPLSPGKKSSKKSPPPTPPRSPRSPKKLK
jgi:hypothetical protein